MKDYSNLLLLLVLIFFTNNLECQSYSNQFNMNIEDSLALVSFYYSTGGQNWINKDNWLTDAPLANWYGISLDEKNRVSEIKLNNNNLTGSIPSEIAHLENLKVLSLTGNKIEGLIPEEIGNLAQLEVLSLRNNKLSGEIPLQIWNLERLKVLNLSNNQLVGNIPSEISNLIELEALHLGYNQLSGAIPKEIGSLGNLKLFYIWGNNLTGELPEEIGYLVNLEVLALNGNNLSGQLPKSIGNLANLEILELEHNKFNGALPKEIGNLKKLVIMYFENNEFSGVIPDEIGNLKNIKDINFSNNQFSGPIPDVFSELSKLEYFKFNSNKIEGALPKSFKNLISLKHLDISRNLLDAGLENIPPHQLDSVFIQRNKFDFADFAITKINAKSFQYNPQDSLGVDGEIIIIEGQRLEFTVETDDIAGNVYKWYKDGILLSYQAERKLIIDKVKREDAGIYTCEITNPIAPELTLYRKPLKINVIQTSSAIEFPNCDIDKVWILNNIIHTSLEFKIFVNQPTNVEIAISNSNGILTKRFLIGWLEKGEHIFSIDVSHFTTAFYFICINLNGNIHINKFLVLK